MIVELDVGHVARDVAVEHRRAHGQSARDEREVGDADQAVAAGAAVDGGALELDLAAVAVEVRTLGNDLDEAAQRARAVESRLRTFQYLEVIDVGQIRIERQQRTHAQRAGGAERDVIDVVSDGVRGLVVAGIEPAQDDGAVALRAAAEIRHAGHQRHVVGKIRDALSTEILRAQRGDRSRYVLQLLLALGGGHHDLLEPAGRGGSSARRLLLSLSAAWRKRN